MTQSLWACHVAQDCQGTAPLPCSLEGGAAVKIPLHTHTEARRWRDSDGSGRKMDKPSGFSRGEKTALSSDDNRHVLQKNCSKLHSAANESVACSPVNGWVRSERHFQVGLMGFDGCWG